MYRLICRLMTVIFLLNCLAPAGWSQSLPTGRYSLDAKVDRQVARAIEQNAPASQFAQADAKTRRDHLAAFLRADEIRREEYINKRNTEFEQMFRATPVEQPSSTRVAPRPNHLRVPPTKAQMEISSFLGKVSRNEIEFKDLIEYVDPIDPLADSNDLTITAYAAEIIGNSVDEAAQLDPSLYDISELQALLPQVEARLLFRLALLGYSAPSYKLNRMPESTARSRGILQSNFNHPIAKTEAVGSIRIALLKVHRFYQKKGIPDPADEYQKQILAQGAQHSFAQAHSPTTLKWGERATTLAPSTLNTEQAMREATRTVNQSGNIASFQKNFLSELKSLKNQDPDEGSSDFQRLQILADYAVAYALEYNPNGLKDIVKVFDEGVKRTYHGNVKNGDFQRKYSPILNAIFVSIFENTRYSSMGDSKTKQVLSLLSEFSDPEKYSLPTRVFALEAAGLLYRPFNAETIQVQQNTPKFAFFSPINLNKPDENLRRTFAWRTSEIYCPLVATGEGSMQTYGLDASQMQALANKLAYIYDGFYDIHTALLEDADKPHHTRDDFPAKCNIFMRNEPNQLKKRQETTTAVMTFTAEALFWVYGGELFAFVGTAFRLTRGAVAALPKAGKAFTVATRGERVAAFNNEIRQGARFANWVYKNKKQQGYIVEMLVEKEPQAVKGVAKARTTEVGPVRPTTPEVEAVRVNHTYQLEGKYSHWNPKRWFGFDRQQNIVGMRVTRLQPNFNTTVAQATFETPINGLHSMQDIEKAWSQLRLVTDPTKPMLYETQPYWKAMLNLRQAQMEQSLLSGLESSLKNQMDLWVPMGEAAQKGAKISSQTKWWNLRWGYPQTVDGMVHAQTPFFVAPRTTMNWTRAASGQMMQPEGIANISEVLPGFYTTGADVATGQVHQQIFEAFFKPLNWQNTAAKTFLPDYMPTATFWKSVQKNPVLGVQLLPQLVWRNRFVGTSAFFGAWMGADHLIYPAYNHWLTGQANQDVQAEINKYGDTFSEQQAKMDEQLMQELGLNTSDKRAMTTYQDVLQAQEEQKDGTLITAPIVFTRRAMNGVPILEGWGINFVDGNTQAAYEHQAHRVNLNRARLKQMRASLDQAQEATREREQEELAFVRSIQEAYNEQVAVYPRGFAALPKAKKQLSELYAQYTHDCLQARTEEERDKIDARFVEQRDKILLPVDVWDLVLQENEQIVAKAKETYAQDADLITPAMEKQIRAIYATYAQSLISNLSIQDETQRQQKNLQSMIERNRSLGIVWADLLNQWTARHPEATQATPANQPAEEPEDAGYGTAWDENAGN